MIVAKGNRTGNDILPDSRNQLYRRGAAKSRYADYKFTPCSEKFTTQVTTPSLQGWNRNFSETNKNLLEYV